MSCGDGPPAARRVAAGQERKHFALDSLEASLLAQIRDLVRVIGFLSPYGLSVEKGETVEAEAIFCHFH